MNLILKYRMFFLGTLIALTYLTYALLLILNYS